MPRCNGCKWSWLACSCHFPALVRILADLMAHCRCLPLKDIGERMLALYHAHEYGDFKGTIQGLLAAYNYELSILQVIAVLNPCS